MSEIGANSVTVHWSVGKTPWLESASELYRPTERLPLVGEVSANFSV
jgi:hypothetical protein